MDWLWDILLFAAGYFAGMYAMSWPTTQIGCALFCSFPLIRRLRNYGDCFDLKGCKKLFTTTIIFNAVILALAIVAVILWAPNLMMVGFWIGYGFTFLLGFRQWGLNQNNVTDFLRILNKFTLEGKDDEAALVMLSMMQ